MKHLQIQLFSMGMDLSEIIPLMEVPAVLYEKLHFYFVRQNVEDRLLPKAIIPAVTEMCLLRTLKFVCRSSYPQILPDRK